MKILIADSSDDSKNILGEILHNQGYACSFAGDGDDFIEKVYRDFPDLIFLSLHTAPDQSFKILERLKSAPSTREIPVMLIAAGKQRKMLTRGYQLGAYDYVSLPYFKEEVLARLRNIIYVRCKTKELEYMMDKDYLTGLYTRSYFMSRMSEELSWSMCYNEPLSVMMLDIDFFKKINDTFGHRCGDEVLKRLAAVLLATLRKEDIACRFGGEEFIILMSNTGSDEAVGLGEELRNIVQNEKFGGTAFDGFHITVSIGITTFKKSCDPSPDVIICQADKALYVSKKEGRNRVSVFYE